MRREVTVTPGKGGIEEGSGTVNCLGLIALSLLLAATVGGAGAARCALIRLQAIEIGRAHV